MQPLTRDAGQNRLMLPRRALSFCRFRSKRSSRTSRRSSWNGDWNSSSSKSNGFCESLESACNAEVAGRRVGSARSKLPFGDTDGVVRWEVDGDRPARGDADGERELMLRSTLLLRRTPKDMLRNCTSRCAENFTASIGRASRLESSCAMADCKSPSTRQRVHNATWKRPVRRFKTQPVYDGKPHI